MLKPLSKLEEKNKHLYAHRLQAYRCTGKNIRRRTVCRHLDNDKNNNSVKNILALGSSKENSLDIPREQIIKIAHRARKSYNQV